MSQAIESKTAAPDLRADCRVLAERARSASRGLAVAKGEAKDRWLIASAKAIESRADEILEANARDVALAPDLGLNAAAVDRLTLNPKRLAGIRQALTEVAHLPDPIGEVV